MTFTEELMEALERQEHDTVGKAFGGTARIRKKSYSITAVRAQVVANPASLGSSSAEQAIKRASRILSKRQFRILVGDLIRYSFLIELTNLKVGSTKMKTRWLPGRILMPQENSYEPIEGTFAPGNDTRAASFDDCLRVFATACNLVCDKVEQDPSLKRTIEELDRNRRVPYEFPLSYLNPAAQPLHRPDNVAWAWTNDLRWLIPAREILRNAPGEHKPGITELVKAKIKVKVFKTDRALTGKDKTNRAKRWEVLAGDFQHATLEQCWSAERKLTGDLAAFQDFPAQIKSAFLEADLIPPDAPFTRCPVTLEPLSFRHLAASLLTRTHGVSQYQVGHLHPLKRGGEHDGANVCWQSANGNRIQGDLTIEETGALLDKIAERRSSLAAS